MAAWKLYLANRAHAKTGTVITGSIDSDYPWANAVDEDRQTVLKPANTNDLVVRVDLGTALTIEAMALGFHTLGTQTATIGLGYSPTDNSADTWGDLTKPVYEAMTNDDNIILTFAAVQKRYWWFAIVGQDAVVEVGELALFDVVRTLTRYPAYPVGRDKQLNLAKSYTLGGYPHVSKRGDSRREWRVGFRMLDRTTDYSYLFSDLFDADYTDEYRPFWITDEYYSSGQPAYMVRIDEELIRSSRAVRDLYEMGFTLVEC